MTKPIKTESAKRLVAISCEEESKPNRGFRPPPDNGRCQCCGKHIGELHPFLSIVGHDSELANEAALLIEKFRPLAPPDRKIDRIVKDFFGDLHYGDEGFEEAERRLIEAYGETRADEFLSYTSAASAFISSWECRGS